MADFFGQLGAIKKSKKNHNMGEPTIHMYKVSRVWPICAHTFLLLLFVVRDLLFGPPSASAPHVLPPPIHLAFVRWPFVCCQDKRTGRPKGDATVSYEEVETAQSAVKWYDGATFMGRPGSKLSVSIAKRPDGDRFGKGKGKGKGGGDRW